ncbi:hypothetical protein Ddc_16220 [Ditylenchus destructor]|nr:hypothetical protein Ddc_16220 [Ditylenchus destructor]
MKQNQMSSDSEANAKAGASANSHCDRKVKGNYNIVEEKDSLNAGLKRTYDNHLLKTPSKLHPNVQLETPIQTFSSRNINVVNSNDNLTPINQLNPNVTHPKSLVQILCWSNSKLVREKEDLIEQCSNLNSELNALKQSKEQNSLVLQLNSQTSNEKETNVSALAKVKRDNHCRTILKDHLQQISELNVKNKKLREENEILKANSDILESIIERLQIILDKIGISVNELCQRNFELEKINDIRRVTEERDRIKVQLDTAIDNSETAMKRISKLDFKLKVERKKHTAEIYKLKEDLAQSQKLKAELENATETYKKHRGKDKKLQEANRLRDRDSRDSVRDNQHWKEKLTAGSDRPLLVQSTNQLLMEPHSHDDQGSSKAKNENGNSGPTPSKKKKPNDPK